MDDRTPRSQVTSRIGPGNLPATVLAATTLNRVDYADAYTVTVPGADDRSPEQWARAVLEGTELGGRARVLWRVLGLRLGPRGSPDHVQGWTIAARDDEWIRVETRSWYASAEAVCRVVRDEVTLAVFLRYDRPPARLIWAAVSPTHQRAVPVLLRQALSSRRRYQSAAAGRRHEPAHRPGADRWSAQPLDDGEQALADIADWGPAEDWSDWVADAAR